MHPLTVPESWAFLFLTVLSVVVVFFGLWYGIGLFLRGLFALAARIWETDGGEK